MSKFQAVMEAYVKAVDEHESAKVLSSDIHNHIGQLEADLTAAEKEERASRNKLAEAYDAFAEYLSGVGSKEEPEDFYP